MIQIILNEVQMAVGSAPNLPGGKILQFSDPKSGIVVVVPLAEEACKILAAQVRTDILIASGSLPVSGDGARRM